MLSKAFIERVAGLDSVIRDIELGAFPLKDGADFLPLSKGNVQDALTAIVRLAF